MTTSPSNAAETYRNLWTRWTPELYEAVRTIESSNRRIYHSHETTMPLDVALATFASNRPLVRDIISATHLPVCDFGLVPNPSTPVDRAVIESLRDNIAQTHALLNAYAAGQWHAGNVNDAVESLTAIIRFSHQLSNEPSFSITRTNAFMLQSVLHDLEAMLTGPSAASIAPEHRSRLNQVLNALDPTDPAGVQRAAGKEGVRPNHRHPDDIEYGPASLPLQIASVRAAADQ